MKKFLFSKWFILPVVAFFLFSMLAVGLSSASFLDTETSTGNQATGWTSSLWTQTSQSDFEAGVVSGNISTSTSPGSVILAAPAPSYAPSSNSGNWTNGAGGYSSNNNYAAFTPTVNVATNSPSSNAGSWTNPANAYADGTNQANIASGSPSANHTYGNYGFSLGSNNITGVRVRADAWTGVGVAANQTGYVPAADADVSGTWQVAQTRVPTGSGNTTGAWTASAGNIWDVVSEVIWTGNDDSDWMNGTTDAGNNYKTFTFSAFSVPGTASIVSVGVYERTSDVGTAGTNNIRGAIIVGGSIYNAGSRNPPANGSQTWSSTALWTTNPKTGAAWTVADINGSGSNPLTQFGVYSTDGNPDIKVYSVFVIVIYTDSEFPAIDETSSDDSDFLLGVANGYDYFTTAAFSVPAGSTINDLTINYRAVDAASAAGANGIRAAIKVNNTLYGTTATNENPAITWTNYSYSFNTNPNTGAAWTATDINGTGANPLQQFGINSADLAPAVGISMLYAEVNYTTASNEQIQVRVTWDNGASWSSWYTSNTTGSEQSFWHDVTSETTWTATKLNNANFRTEVRAVSVDDSGDLRLDWLPVEVTSSDLSLWPQTYGNYGISLAGSYISTVEVGIEAYAASSEKVELEVSWNNGSSWSAMQTSSALPGADPNSTTWFDFTSATTWTPALLNDSNFKVKVSYKDNGAYGQVSLDFIPVRISYRYTSGTLASQVLDTAVSGSRWDGLIWDSALPAGTDIAFQIRASDTPFLKTDSSPSWTSVTGSPLSSSQVTSGPAANTGSAWTNPANAYADGSSYASITSGMPSGSNTWGTYGFNLGGKTIDQVRVRYDAWHGTLGSVSSWVSPASDTANGWSTPANAYDGDTGTSASISVSGGGVSPYLELAVGSITSDKVRIWSERQGTRIAGIDVDVYYNSQWNNIYSGTLVVGSYQEYAIGSTQTVTGMRIRYSSSGSPAQEAYIQEAQFNSLTPASPPQISIDVSWDGGASWSSTQNSTLTSSETTYWYDVTSATSWTDTKLTDSNLKVRALAQSVYGAVEVRLDWLAVEVAYQPGATGAISVTNGDGRYKQWRAILTTADAGTPALSEVRLYYDGG